MFTHFQKVPNREVFRRTKTIRVRCKTSERPQWDLTFNLTRTTNHKILLAEIPAYIPKAKERVHTDNSEEFIKAWSVSAVGACHEYSSSFGNQQDRRKSCLTCERGNIDSDRPTWPSRSVEFSCHVRNVRDKMADGMRTTKYVV